MFIFSFESIISFQNNFPHLVPFISVWVVCGREIEIYLFCFNPVLFCILLHVVFFFSPVLR